MKHLIYALQLLFFYTTLFGQNKSISIFQKQEDSKDFNNYYYSKTDFSIIDTLSFWRYQLDTTDTNDTKGPQHYPIGELLFWRSNPIVDGISKKIYNRLWTPELTFSIFKISDSAYCYEISRRTRMLSSCLAPDVGGDMIFIGEYIFVSRGVCVSCQRHDTKVDYCRPIINYIFSKVDSKKVTTLRSLVSQFVIEKGIYPNRNLDD